MATVGDRYLVPGIVVDVIAHIFGYFAAAGTFAFVWRYRCRSSEAYQYRYARNRYDVQYQGIDQVQYVHTYVQYTRTSNKLKKNRTKEAITAIIPGFVFIQSGTIALPGSSSTAKVDCVLSGRTLKVGPRLLWALANNSRTERCVSWGVFACFYCHWEFLGKLEPHTFGNRKKNILFSLKNVLSSKLGKGTYNTCVQKNRVYLLKAAYATFRFISTVRTYRIFYRVRLCLAKIHGFSVGSISGGTFGLTLVLTQSIIRILQPNVLPACLGVP